MAPVITALRLAAPARFAVEVDGEPWRTLPEDVVVRCRLRTGLVLDRERLRELRSAIRQSEALGTAVRAIRACDHTAASLDARLGARGIADKERQHAVAVLERAGLVDDARFAHGRAGALAGRGAGDLMIADDLERQGVPARLAQEALGALEPEAERAARLYERRGGGPRAVRFLAGKGFTEESIEPLVAGLGDAALG